MKKIFIKKTRDMRTLMQILKPLLLFGLSVVVVPISCGKDDTLATNNEAFTQNLPGTIYFEWDGINSYALNSQKITKISTASISSGWYSGYDVSWDGKKMLFVIDPKNSSNYDWERLVLRQNDNPPYNQFSKFDNGNIFDVMYEKYDWKIVLKAYVSPNEKYVATAPNPIFDAGIDIVDVSTGKEISSFSRNNAGGKAIGRPFWLSTGDLCFLLGNNLYVSKSSENFETANALLQLNEPVNYVAVNPQGTKIVFRRENKHLWMCDIDGSNLRQITTCKTYDAIKSDGENTPVFSPDGNYIAFTAATQSGVPLSNHDFLDGSWVAAVGGGFGYIVVIPADGKLYDLNDINSGAIWLREPGNNKRGIPSSGTLVWR